MTVRIVSFLFVMGIGNLFLVPYASAQFFFGKPSRDIVVKSVLKPNGATIGVPHRYGITRRDVELINELDGIARAYPTRTIPKSLLQYGDLFAVAHLTGTTHEFQEGENAKLKAGRFLLEKDIQNLNNVVVITESDAVHLFGQEEALGKNLHIQDDYYLIVGVLDSTKSEAYIPISTMRSRSSDLHLSTENGTFRTEIFEISEVRIQLNEDSDVNDVVKTISELLAARHESQDYSISRRRR